jgi:hypothetical protein
MNSEQHRAERAHLRKLTEALDIPIDTMKRDSCDYWAIVGTQGNVVADGSGYLIYVATESARDWRRIKRHLAFAKVTQDGDTEGCIRLDRLPVKAEAELLRAAIGIKRERSRSIEARIRASIIEGSTA